MPLLTNEMLASRYPQSITVDGEERTRVQVSDLDNVGDLRIVKAWYYFPTRAADNLDCWQSIIEYERRMSGAFHEFAKLTFKSGLNMNCNLEDAIYVNESTLALIRNYQ